MRRTATTWLACFAGTLATAVGVLAMVARAPSWKDASARELSSPWSRVSSDVLNKYGGITSYGTKTEQSNYTICQTNICRSVGGHGYICTDFGTALVTITRGFSYAKSGVVNCGNEMMYTFTNCTAFVRNNGNCGAGAMTYTDFFDP